MTFLSADSYRTTPAPSAIIEYSKHPRTHSASTPKHSDRPGGELTTEADQSGSPYLAGSCRRLPGPCYPHGDT